MRALQNPVMTNGISFPNLEEAMDEFWFHQNVLCFQHANLSILNMLQRDGSLFGSSSSSSEYSSYSEPACDGSKKRQKIQSMKKLETPYQLQRSSWRGHLSLSELENYELKGFNDLGFKFDGEGLSPHMLSTVPGLQRRLSNKQHRGSEEMKAEQARRRPYLSEAWLMNRSDSPLLHHLLRLPKSVHGADMKRHLRFWAHRVASSAFHDSEHIGCR